VSRITVQHDLNMVAVSRDGRSLHSLRDPQREAGLWVAGRPAKVHGLVLVLGLGGAYHVREWHRQTPELCLVVCDFDAELFAAAGIQYAEGFDNLNDLGPGLHGLCLSADSKNRPVSLLERGYSVVRFRPAWTGREAEFSALEDTLLDRAPESLDPDFLLKADEWPRGLDVNIKSLTATDGLLADNEDQKLLLALRELVA